jgi:hypothetical protein
MSSSGTDWLERARGDSPASASRRGIAGIILAIAGGITVLVETFFEGFGRIFDVFGAARDFLVALISEPIVILRATAAETAASLTGSGEWAFFGPATFAVGVGSIILAFWLWTVIDPEIPFVDRIIPWR